MQVFAHGSVGISLDHQIYIPLLILIARRGVRSYHRFFHLRPLVLRQQRRGDLQSGDIVGIWKRETELFRVVIDLFYRFELEVYESLIAASECSSLG